MFLGWQAAWLFSFVTGKAPEPRMWDSYCLASQAAPVSHRDLIQRVRVAAALTSGLCSFACFCQREVAGWHTQ